jgi:hypothetical protein
VDEIGIIYLNRKIVFYQCVGFEGASDAIASERGILNNTNVRFGQRVLSDLYRTRLSRRRMIWLLLPPPLHQARPATQRKTEKETQLADGRGMGKEPNHTTARKSGPL